MNKIKVIILLIAVVLLSVSASALTTVNLLNGRTDNRPVTDNDTAAESSAEIVELSVRDSGYSVSDIADKCTSSVVSIMVKGETVSYSGTSKQTKKFDSSGTGVIINDEGYIVTCQHVIDSAKEITVVLADEKEYEAELIGEVANFDMAVIKIDAPELSPAVIGDSDSLRLGENIVVIGNPLGEFGGSVSAGVLSGNEREVTIEDIPLRLLQTDAAVNPGNSGGGLFSAKGELIGMVNAKVSSEGIEGIGFAIPINSIIDKVQSLIDTGDAGDKVVLGVSTKPVEYRVKGTSRKIKCLEVVTVKEDGSADKSGIIEGDLLVSIDGKKLETNDSLAIAVKYAKPGDKASIELYRDDVLTEIEVTLLGKE